MASILVVEDRDGMRALIVKSLAQEGHRALGVASGTEALGALEKERFHLMLTDLRLPGIDGLMLMQKARALDAGLPVILMTAYATVDVAIRALRQGADDFLTKPFEIPDLLARVTHVLTPPRLRGENAYLREELGRDRPTEAFVAESAAMRRVLELVDRVAGTGSTVCLHGETGTGKGLVARLVHERSARRALPFVHVVSAALSPSLLESELFGHEKGAFTGATALRQGRFEVADGGTLFLDEIGDVPPEIQVKLLRVVQEQAFERVGSSKVVKVDVRWITATHRNMDALIREGRFREDLYYRLNVFPIPIPPLRERLEDLPGLAAGIVARLGARLDSPVREVSEGGLAVLRQYPWPGNVRELENVLERAMLLSDHGTLEAEDFSFALEAGGRPPAPEGAPGGSLVASVERTERELILQALAATQGNRTQAARLLGLSRTTLQYKLAKHGIAPDPAAGNPAADGDPSVPTV